MNSIQHTAAGRKTGGSVLDMDIVVPTPITLSGYLTETSLSDALLRIVGLERWLGGQLRVEKCWKRWDMGFRSDSGIVVVEYDGDAHYCNTLKIKADAEKDRIAHAQGWRTVRLPYWMQLDSLTVQHYFGMDARIDTSFPHGFITTKVFPASFCELGIARFEREVLALPTSLRDAVIQSLRDRAEEHGAQFRSDFYRGSCNCFTVPVASAQ